MSATFVRIGDDVVILSSIKGVGIRPYRDGRFSLHLNNRRSPAYIGSDSNCVILREAVLDLLMAHYQIDVLDLNVDLEPEVEVDEEDYDVTDLVGSDFVGL